MLSTSATANTTVGTGSENPSDALSAVAHTASNTALITSTTHAIS